MKDIVSVLFNKIHHLEIEHYSVVDFIWSNVIPMSQGAAIFYIFSVDDELVFDSNSVYHLR